MNDIDSIFGKVTPPSAMNIGGIANSEPDKAFGILVAYGIRIFITVAGLFMLLYLLWGGLDWITSSGEKEKLTKAQNKITNAAIGLLLIFAVLVIFNVVAGNMLGIVDTSNGNGWSFILPVLK